MYNIYLVYISFQIWYIIGISYIMYGLYCKYKFKYIHIHIQYMICNIYNIFITCFFSGWLLSPTWNQSYFHVSNQRCSHRSFHGAFSNQPCRWQEVPVHVCGNLVYPLVNQDSQKSLTFTVVYQLLSPNAT